MKNTLKALAFDVDPETLAVLQAGLPDWEIEVVEGGAAAVRREGWNAGAADLFIVQAAENEKQASELCALLARAGGLVPAGTAPGYHSERRENRRRTTPRNEAPLLVLVPANRSALVRDVLRAGAAGCLVLPIQADQVVSMLARAQRDNQPGRHTLNLDPAQAEDRWRDDGGQG